MTQPRESRLGPGAVGFYWAAVVCGILALALGLYTERHLWFFLTITAIPAAVRLISHYLDLIELDRQK